MIVDKSTQLLKRVAENQTRAKIVLFLAEGKESTEIQHLLKLTEDAYRQHLKILDRMKDKIK